MKPSLKEAQASFPPSNPLNVENYWKQLDEYHTAEHQVGFRTFLIIALSGVTDGETFSRAITHAKESLEKRFAELRGVR